METKEGIVQLVDPKKFAILKVLANAKEELCLKEISQLSKVPMATCLRLLRGLVNQHWVQRREWKTSKVYHLVQDERTEMLRSLLEEEVEGVEEFVRAMDTVSGIQQIIVHGTKKKGKANILLLGENIPSAPLEQARVALKEKGFELSYLTLTQQQYEQLVKMGLYAGEKQVLR